MTKATRFRVSLPDAPGELEKVTNLAAQLDVSVTDMEIDHMREQLVLVVARDQAGAFETALRELHVFVSRADLDDAP
jgi:hypothetical protein